MPLNPIDEEPLEFPINGVTYTIPPVGIEDGWRLADILLDPNTKNTKGLNNDDLFTLAMGEAYEQMKTNRVPLHLAFRAGMASLAHFRVLSAGDTSEAAMKAAQAIWESGLDPKALEEWANSHSTTTTGTAAAPRATSRASTSGTSTRPGTPRTPRPRSAAPKRK